MYLNQHLSVWKLTILVHLYSTNLNTCLGYSFEDSLTYDDCKATLRCNQGYVFYDLHSVSQTYASTHFLGGQLNPEYVFTDFESYSQGTLNWKTPLGANIPENQKLPSVPHFSSLNLPLLEEFQFYWDSIPHKVLHNFGNDTTILHKWCTFDTQSVSLKFFAELQQSNVSSAENQWNGTIDREIISVPGILKTAPASRGPDAQVAVFNFKSVNINSTVEVRASGPRPLVVLSRSSIVFNTTLAVNPGTLGGFPGGTGNVSFVNVNGAGTTSTRIYPFTLTTFAQDINEIQTITTSADPGQTLRGNFVIGIQPVPVVENARRSRRTRIDVVRKTRPLSHNESPEGIEHALESAFGDIIGDVHVTRSVASTDEGGYTWTIEFVSNIGDVPQLVLVSGTQQVEGKSQTLLGEGAAVTIHTIQDANQLKGHFHLSFAGEMSRSIPVSVAENHLETILREDFEIVTWAKVVRHSLSQVLDRTTGKSWRILLAVDQGNNEASTPLAVEQHLLPGQRHYLRVVGNVETTSTDDHTSTPSGLEGINPNAFVVDTLLEPESTELSDAINLWRNSQTVLEHIGPFTVTFGGQGGSNGGRGGGILVRHDVAVSPEFMTKFEALNSGQPQVEGGSGGSIGGTLDSISTLIGTALENSLPGANIAGTGGAGGGFVELSAEIDVTLGSSAKITVNGGDGNAAAHGGGGGSGGSILVYASHGAIRNLGTLVASGGNGGNGLCDETHLNSIARLQPTSDSIASSQESLRYVCGGFGLPGAGGSGGVIHLVASSVYMNTTVLVPGGRSGNLISKFDGKVSTIPHESEPPNEWPAWWKSLHGKRGTATVHSLLSQGTGYYVDYNSGAATTTGSLAIHVEADELVSNAESLGRVEEHVEGVEFHSPVSHNGQHWGSDGVIHRLEPVTNLTDLSKGPRPGRVSVFMRVAPSNTSKYMERTWSGCVALHEPHSRRDDSEWPIGQVGDIAIGVGVVNGHLRHGTGLSTLEELGNNSKTESLRFPIKSLEWYKLDIYVDWDAGSYDIRVNDIEVVVQAKMWSAYTTSYIEAVGLYGGYSLRGGGSAWFDEVYVGRSYTTGFRCPQTLVRSTPRASTQSRYDDIQSAKVKISQSREQSKWSSEQIGPETSFMPMSHHSSHLSQQEYYQNQYVSGIKHGDGFTHRRFFSEVDNHKFEEFPETYNIDHAQQDNAIQEPALKVSSFLFHSKGSRQASIAGILPSVAADDPENLDTSNSSPGRYYWYGEHHNSAAGNESVLSQVQRDPSDGFIRYPTESELGLNSSVPTVFLGGIGSCSTLDFKEWKNEGIVLNFANISYFGGIPRTQIEIQGGIDGIGVPTAGKQHVVEIPVTSIHRDGDWNTSVLFAQRPKVLFNNHTAKYVLWAEVHDYGNELGAATTASSKHPAALFEFNRSFLPDGNETYDQSVFQDEAGDAYLIRTYYATVDYILPEPVMQPMWESIKDPNGTIDFGLTYHRAMYDLGYDDSDDICIQRLRGEDVPDEILYFNMTTEAEDWVQNIYSNSTKQQEPWVKKDVVGQGDPVVLSRFKNPNRTENNAWLPSSVPGVKAQEWSQNYMDKNVADNPVHPTYADKLIGPPQVVEQRRTRFLAISKLSFDFLETSGSIAVIEGALADNGLIDSVIDPEALGWTTKTFGQQDDGEPWKLYPRRFFPHRCEGGAEDDEWEDCNVTPVHDGQSTEPGQVWGLDEPFNFITEYDWSWRHHQYRWEKGDRSDAPVNFKDQLVKPFVPGRGTEHTTKARAFIRDYDYNCFRGATTHLPDDHPDHIPADPLFRNQRSQRYTKTEGIDISHTEEHLLGW